MKTFRRDKLLRLAKAGKLAVVDSYHFDDMFGASRNGSNSKPVKVITNGREADGSFYCVFESDFSSGVGRAWQNENGTVTLIVHSNLNYTFKILN
jgi:hypothetical protein